MALSRTSALAATLALLAAGCGAAQHEASDTGTSSAPASGKAQLAPAGQKPLVVKGTGFRPNEKVAVAAKGIQSQQVSAQADSSGSFEATFERVNSCDSITVTATGSDGSHAEFNLSQIVCMGS